MKNEARVHVSGVGGVGMSAVAQLLVAEGRNVTGSDRFRDRGVELPVLRQLEAMGVELVPQDGSGITPETEVLVLSTAVEADNPERVRAAELGVPERHRSEVLAELASCGPVAAVAGTSGKTTCTGWLARVLTECGMDPNMVNGGGVVGWKSDTNPGNVRRGGDGNWWVVEVDESDRSLLRFSPKVALINTVTADHHGLDETVDLFRQFAARVEGPVVCGPGVKSYLEGCGGDLREVKAPLSTPLPGTHNAWNAAAVGEMAKLCGVPPEDVMRALQRFQGVERRLERCTPEGSGPRVYDDYAHNPEKLLAAMRAVRPHNGRLHVLWRPHGFAPLRQNLHAYAEAFVHGLRSGDCLYLLPVFFAGGTAPKEVHSGDLADELRGAAFETRLCEDYPETVSLDRNDVLLVTGARDPELPRFAHRVAEAVSRSRNS